MASGVTKSIVQPASVPTPATQYSQALRVRAGEWLFISGQVPIDADGILVGKGDIKAQSRQVFENIKAILEEAGGSFEDVVKLCVFITDMDSFPGFAEIRSEYLKKPFPAATAVAVSRLVSPDWLIEIDAVAALE